MKVVLLHGSMRKNGNTALLAREFLRGCTDSGHEVEKFRLADMSIRDCLGCAACRKNGGKCVQQDDMQQIYAKMQEADVIVLASPVYFYTWTSLMKRMIDRTFAVEKLLTHKTFYLIAAAAAPEEQYVHTMLDSFHQYVDCFQGEGNTEGGYLIGYHTRLPGDIRDSPAMAQAYIMGKNIKYPL